MPCQLNLGNLDITLKTDAEGHAVEAQFDLPDGSTVVRPFPTSGELIMQLGLGLGLTHVQQAGGGGGGGETLEVIDFAGNTEITEADYPTLTAVTTFVNFEGCTALATMNFPLLAEVGGYLRISENEPTLVSEAAFPSLVSIGGALVIQVSDVLETIDLSSLETVGSELFIRVNSVLSSLLMSSLVSAGAGLFFQGNTALVTLDLSSLESCGAGGGISFASCTSLMTVNISALLSHDSDFDGQGCALSQASVDAILVKFASLDGTSGTTLFENHFVELQGGTNAAPSATGLTAKATLEGRGNTVTVNE